MFFIHFFRKFQGFFKIFQIAGFSRLKIIKKLNSFKNLEDIQKTWKTFYKNLYFSTQSKKETEVSYNFLYMVCLVSNKIIVFTKQFLKTYLQYILRSLNHVKKMTILYIIDAYKILEFKKAKITWNVILFVKILKLEQTSSKSLVLKHAVSTF